MSGLIEERLGRTLLLRLDTGPTGLLKAKLCAQLEARFAEAGADQSIAAIVIVGASPGVFIRHFDVASIVRSSLALQRGEIQAEDFPASVVFRAYQSIAECPKPVIAAINGVCMGGGFELALCCAMRVASADVAEIGLPETRIGIFPGGGGTQRLPRLIGEARAIDFILRGAVVNATDALALGLVTEVADDALARALKLAEALGHLSAPLLATTLNLIRAAHDRPITEGVHAEALAFAAQLRDDPRALAEMQQFLEGDQVLGSYRRGPVEN